MKKIILLGLLLFIVGCTTQTGTQAVQTGPNLYENDYYSLEYPSGWIEAEAMDGQKLSLLGPTEDFVNIVIDVTPFTGTFDKFTDDFKEDLERSRIAVSTDNIVESNSIVSGQSTKVLEYTYELMDNELKVETHLLLYNGNAITIAYQSTTDKYSENYQLFEDSLDTFTLK